MRVACVGGGPAGLYFAMLMKLWAPGNDVTVYERNMPGLAHHGGVVVDRRFLARLARLDLETAQQIGRGAARWQDQVINFRGERYVHRDDVVSYGISRQRLAEVLAARAVQLRADIRYFCDVRDMAELRDADLILAADGAASTLRDSQPFGTTVTDGRNKFAWLGTSRPFDAFTLIFEQTEAGWIWAYAYQHAPGASTFIVECPPETWSGLGLADGPATVGLDKIAEIFAEHLTGHPLSARLPDSTDARWLTFQSVRNARWYRGRVVLAGDSAHAAHFSAGSGVALAIEDAIALAGQLCGTPCLLATGSGHGHSAALSCLTPALEAYQQQRTAASRQQLAEASRSAALLENLSRYADLAPGEFAQAVRARRAPLLPALPPRVFGLLHRAGKIR